MANLVPYVIEQTGNGERSYDIFFQTSEGAHHHAG